MDETPSLLSVPIVGDANEYSLGIKLSSFQTLTEGWEVKTIADVWEQIIKPLTEKDQCSFCKYQQSMNDSVVGEAEVFISHVWKYNLFDVMDALKAHFKEEPDIVIWIDVFSQNYHTSLYQWMNFGLSWCQPAIERVRRVVVLSWPWDDPTNLRRAWCVYEVFCALSTNAKVECALYPTESLKFVKDVFSDPFRFLDFLLKADCRLSESSNREDKEIIFSKITASDISFADINGSVFLGMLNQFSLIIHQDSSFLTSQCEMMIADRVPVNNPSQKAGSLLIPTESSITSYGVKLSYFRRFIDEHGGINAFQGLTTEEVCQKFLKNETETHGTSLLQILRNEESVYVGKAQWFISHAWKYKFLDAVELMEEYFKTEVGEEGWANTVVWFDIFCHSQYQTEERPFEWWANEFSTHLQSIGKILILACQVDHTEGSVSPDTSTANSKNDSFKFYCFKHIWCVFEFYCSVKVGCRIEVAMSAEDEEKLDSLARSQSSKLLFTDIRKLLNLRTAEATVPSDLSNIQDAIQQDVGYKEVERKVYSALMNVFLRKLGIYSKKSVFDAHHEEALQIIMKLCFKTTSLST